MNNRARGAVKPTRGLDLTWRIAQARLQLQGLIGASAPKSAADVVRALGAVQSQDYAGAKWALGMRATGLTDASIDEAFDRGDIVRTHVLRPTWHFVAPEDLRWMLALTGPRIAAVMSSYKNKLGLDAAVVRKSHASIEQALATHGSLTRTQLAGVLDRAGIVTKGALPLLLMQAEIDAVICSGPRKGKQSTYALLAQRVPVSRDLVGDEALLELTRRFFASRSPATPNDFSWWSGLTVTTCRRGIDLASNELSRLDIGDVTYWAPPGFELPERVGVTAHLLPNYDEYFIGFRDRSAIAHRLGSAAMVTGGNARINHVVVIDGQLVGGWKRLREKGGTVVQLQRLVDLSGPERRRVDDAIKRFERFIAGPVVVRSR